MLERDRRQTDDSRTDDDSLKTCLFSTTLMHSGTARGSRSCTAYWEDACFKALRLCYFMWIMNLSLYHV